MPNNRDQQLGAVTSIQEPEWIVNDMGELGVKVGGRFFFLYKGDSIEYADGTHDDGTPILWRQVGKVEFGETCWPLKWVLAGRREHRYTVELVYRPGLSFGKPEDAAWRPLGAVAPAASLEPAAPVVPAHDEPVVPMGFDIALRHIKRGERVARWEWANSDAWVCLGDAHPGLDAAMFWNRHTRAMAEANGGSAPVRGYFIRAESGHVQMGWTPTQADLLADDWRVL